MDGWSLPDPLKVSLDAVGRAEHFRAMAACGFELWSNSTGIAMASRGAGVECADIGVGWSMELPDPPAKEVDVVALEFNKWAPLSRQVLASLDADCRMIPPVDHARLLQELGKSRLLVWPSRIEGWDRIQCEARAMGTVPVSLRSNPYATGHTEANGAVLVDRLEDMPHAVQSLLADPGSLEALSRRAVVSAREQVDWDSYVKRVNAALGEHREVHNQFGGMCNVAGEAIAKWESARDACEAELEQEIETAEAELAKICSALTSVRASQFSAATPADALGFLLRLPLVRRLVWRLRSMHGPLYRPPIVLVFPGSLDDSTYTMVRILERLGADIRSRPNMDVVHDLVLGWHDSNWARTPGMTHRPLPVRRGLVSGLRQTVGRCYWNCSPLIDISKSSLGRAFEKVFCRSLALDPLMHKGLAVEKSDENATHDGRVIHCPYRPLPGKVYQVFVDTPENPLRQWRITVMSGVAVLAVEREMDPEDRFKSGSIDGRLVPLHHVLRPGEPELIARLCRELHLEYCELDALRNAERDLFVVDVNPTPVLTGLTVPDPDERARVVEEQARQFMKALRSPRCVQ
jgi:hypothetical protein